jgi:aspartyl-tRNA(Asn)/glutamyl-tRNA(Gln) amidotransferase subunit A
MIHIAAADIRAGRLSPVDLLESCLERIDRFESQIRAWVLVDHEGARTEAKRLTDELKQGHYRGPLHGIPIGIKDIIDVFDWPTAAGSKLWANSIARQDATVVRKLREAGAIILGKTVTTQYASFDPSPTRNPWNPQRTPGGSSSGSAAAVAAGMCLGTLGTQTGGSITRPASYCGVASCKPSFGMVSRHGVVPLAHSMDHPGPMAKCVRDLAIILETIAGPDRCDPLAHSLRVPNLSTLVEGKLSPPRLGRLRGLFEDRAEPEMRRTMDAVVKELCAKGAKVEDVVLPDLSADVLVHHRIVMAVEAAQFHEPRLRKHPEDYEPNITNLLNEGLTCPAPEYARTKSHQSHLRNAEFATFITDYDALICPATTGPAPDKATTGDPAFNSPWSYTGMPSVSFPVGLSEDGLPLAIQLVGAMRTENRVFPAAAWCETVFAGRMPEAPL